MGFWDKLKDPFKGIPVVGGALDAVYDTLPVDNLVRMGEEIGKGNWAGAAGNLGIAALDTAAFLIPGSQAALKATQQGTKVASKAGAKTVLKGIMRPGTVAGLSKTGKVASNLAGPSGLKWSLGSMGVGKALEKVAGPTKALAAGSTKPASAADFRRFEESSMAKTRPSSSAANFRKADIASMDKFNAMQKKKKNVAAGAGLGVGRLPSAAAPAVPAAAPEAPVTPATPEDITSNLAALTPEQEAQVAEQQRKLQSQYDLLTAEFDKQKREGEQKRAYDIGLAQNIAAGEGQNLRTQLANIGMEYSPVSAIVGQEGISNTRAQQQATAEQSLASIIGQIEADKRKQQSEYDLGKAEVEKLMSLLRIQNTLGEQQNLYGQMEGI
jgi:hypothetical protein